MSHEDIDDTDESVSFACIFQKVTLCDVTNGGDTSPSSSETLFFQWKAVNRGLNVFECFMSFVRSLCYNLVAHFN